AGFTAKVSDRSSVPRARSIEYSYDYEHERRANEARRRRQGILVRSFSAQRAGLHGRIRKNCEPRIIGRPAAPGKRARRGRIYFGCRTQKGAHLSMVVSIRLSFPALVAGAAAVLAAGVPPPASAQRDIPDLTSIWARRGCTGGQSCPFIPSELPLKARAIGFMQAFDEPLGPKYDCVQATMPSLVIDPYNFAIEQHEDRLVLTYEKDDIVRTIWLEGHAPQPAVYDVFWQGHSVGRYQDGALVGET